MLLGKSDVALEVAYILNQPAGILTVPIYHQAYYFAEKLPEQLSPIKNIVYPFEPAVWLALLVTLPFVTMTMAFMARDERVST